MNLLEKMAPEERAGTGIHEAMTVELSPNCCERQPFPRFHQQPTMS